MPSRSDPAPNEAMERALRDLGAHLELSGPPDSSARVRARIEREEVPSPGSPRLGLPRLREQRLREQRLREQRLRLAAVAIAALVLVASVAAIPSARHAVADLLGLRGDRIELRQPSVTVTTAAADTLHPDTLRLGQVVPLGQARTRLPELLVPTDPGLGSPARVLADPGRPEVSFVYTGADGRITYLVTEWRANAGPFFDKMLGPRASLEAATVNGGPGAFVSGPDHFFFYTDAQGRFFEEQGRLAGNALIWQQGPLTLRIEGDFSKSRALEIAASMR